MGNMLFDYMIVVELFFVFDYCFKLKGKFVINPLLFTGVKNQIV